MVRHDREVPSVDYLAESTPVTEELLRLAEPLPPTEIFRIAAECAEGDCAHWSVDACSLVERVVDLVPAESLTLPRCDVRRQCQWFAQSGRDACRRCARVVTQNVDPTAAMRMAATPPGSND